MTEPAKTNKGHVLEEVLRAYFLRAGFYVIRGAPFRFGDEDLTDIDLWLYERPTSTYRRVQICDLKYKLKPKAIERIFWTRGVADALEVDGAFVATTDKRESLRIVAKKLGIHLFDGDDLQRLQASSGLLFPDRLTDEELTAVLASADQAGRSKHLQEERRRIVGSLCDGFGLSSMVRSIESFAKISHALVAQHPDSDVARAQVRLALLAASIASQSLDFVGVDSAFRSNDERRKILEDAVRFGAPGKEATIAQIHFALGLAEKYAPSGKAAAKAIERGVQQYMAGIPADIIAEHAVRLVRNDHLFDVGREMEALAYRRELQSFDQIEPNSKSMLAVLLDYSGVDREKFARAWTTRPAVTQSKPAKKSTLFD